MKLNKKIYFFDKGIFNPYRMSNVKLKVNQAVKDKEISSLRKNHGKFVLITVIQMFSLMI